MEGQYRENVMYFQILGATNDTAFANSNALAVFIATNLKPLFLAVNSSDYFLDAIFVRRLQPSTGQYAAVDYAPFSQVGTRGTGAVSEQLCPCVTLIPPMGTKSAGKIFLPSIDKADCNLNVFQAGYITAVDTLINALVAGGSVAGGTCNLVIYSRKLRTYSQVNAHHLSPVLGYQRRRSHPVGS